MIFFSRYTVSRRWFLTLEVDRHHPWIIIIFLFTVDRRCSTVIKKWLATYSGLSPSIPDFAAGQAIFLSPAADRGWPWMCALRASTGHFPDLTQVNIVESMFMCFHSVTLFFPLSISVQLVFWCVMWSVKLDSQPAFLMEFAVKRVFWCQLAFCNSG